MSTTVEKAAEWFAERIKNTPMPGARTMFEMAAAALFEKSNREAEPQTKADHIRAMSNEELAKLLMDANGCKLSIPFCQERQECLDEMPDIPEENCMACMLAWLQQPAEVE